MQKDFLTLEDRSPEEFKKLLDETLRLKKDGTGDKPLEGKTIAIIFNKSSTRTRMGFEIGMQQLGGYAMFLSNREMQLGRGESFSDTAKVMSRFVDGIVVRTFDQHDLEELASSASIPVINALTDMYHPCQAVADYATILEKKGSFKGISAAYIGDGNNVANSFVIGGAMLGLDIRVATPAGFEIKPGIVSKAKSLMEKSGGSLLTTTDVLVAAKDADTLYTDVWASMGEEEMAEDKKKSFTGFTIDDKLLESAKPDCMVMHCLPAHRGEEISAGVIDGPKSVVWDQAENKLHAQKAVLKLVLIGE
jgi:ornithine carbamoyltransferase